MAHPQCWDNLGHRPVFSEWTEPVNSLPYLTLPQLKKHLYGVCNVTCIFFDMRTPMSSRSTETEITTDRRGCKKLQNRIQLIKINPCPAIIYENGNFGSVTITNIVYSILRPESCVLEYRVITGSGPVIYQKKKGNRTRGLLIKF